RSGAQLRRTQPASLLPYTTLFRSKRIDVSGAPLQGGAVFVIHLDPKDGVGDLTVTDNDANDNDPDNGQFQITNVLLGTYTVIETVPPSGFALDDDTDRLVTVTATELNPVIGTQGSDDPGNSDESDFHNRLGSISWEKRIDISCAPLQGRAVFFIHLPSTTLFRSLTVTDNDANDNDPDNGQFQI